MTIKNLKDFPMISQVVTKEVRFTVDGSVIMNYASFTQNPRTQ